MKEAQIIFTFRPLSLKKPMSIINAITRTMQGYPRDHVAILFEGNIYESSFGKGVGVQRVNYNVWKSERVGTDVLVYTVPKETLDFDLFYKLEGVKYDNRAAIFHLLGFEKKLIKRPNKAINCSELVALMLGLDQAWKALPKDVDNLLRMIGAKSINKTL